MSSKPLPMPAAARPRPEAKDLTSACSAASSSLLYSDDFNLADTGFDWPPLAIFLRHKELLCERRSRMPGFVLVLLPLNDRLRSHCGSCRATNARLTLSSHRSNDPMVTAAVLQLTSESLAEASRV